MKTTFVFGVAAFFAVLVISCKQGELSQEEAVLSEKTSADESMKNVLSSNAAVQNPDDKRKFVRTADIKFKVKNVAQSTYKIENAVGKFGGIVTNTDLQSQIEDRSQMKVSADSTLQTTKYSVRNNITLRIPNIKLDTVIKSIAKEIDYLDFRVIKADDVSLQLLAADLSQQRFSAHTKRLQNDIDQKGKKLNDISNAENEVLNKKEQSDNTRIQNLSMLDQIKYSTITLAIYQNETIKSELVAIEKNNKAYGNFGLEIMDGLKTGWFILASIVAFIVQLWSLVLLALLGIFIYKKFLRNAKPA